MMSVLMKDMDRFLVFVIGAIIGSFLNVCIHRLPKKQSIVYPPSYCPHCRKNLLWYDNIPILSYIVLMGRCGFCRKRISPRYLAVEVLTAMMFFILYMVFGIQEKFFIYAALVAALIVVTFIDFRTGEIPDEITLGGLVVGLLLSFAFPAIFDTASRLTALKSSAIGVVAGGGAIFAMAIFGQLLFKKEAMGGGDVKLMAFVGSILGWQLALLTFFIAPFFGAIVGIPLRMAKGRETIPYGPYLSLGVVVAIFYGHNILRFLFSGF